MSIQYPLPPQIRKALLVASAGQTVFGPLDFILFDEGDVKVSVKAADAEAYTELPSGMYTVAPAAPATAFPAMFTVTLSAGRSAGDLVEIRGSRLGGRTTDVTRGGRLQSQALETELDRQVATEQELRRDIDQLFASVGAPTIIQPLPSGDIRRYGAIEGAAIDNYGAISAAQAENKTVIIPEGDWGFGQQILPLAGQNIIGRGPTVSALHALSAVHNGILIQDVDNVGVRGLTLNGVFDPVGFDTGGLGIVRANSCRVFDVVIENWSAQGLALRWAAYNQIGDITTINNGDRGVNCSALSHDNTFGNIIAFGNQLAAFLIGYGCYRNTVGSVIGGGHQNSAIWIMNDCHENSIGRAILNAPAAGYEDNSSVVFAWHAHRNYIGSIISNGWRRGIQFKAANVVPSGDPDIDLFLTEGNTNDNTIGNLWVATDNGLNAAGVYFDAVDGRVVDNNKINSIHVSNSTYGVWDTTANSTNNSLGINQSFRNVTTPFSLPALGSNKGTFRANDGSLGFDCQDPTNAFHFRASLAGDVASAIENASTANSTAKTAAHKMLLRDTTGALKTAGKVQAVPLDANALSTHVVIWARKNDAEVDVLKVYGTGVMDMRNNGSNPAFTLSRTDAHAANQVVAEFDGVGMDSGGAAQTYGQLTVVAKVITAGAESGEWRLATYQAGALGNRIQIGGGVYHPTATGGDKGNNTINFGAVYDDNVLLTDYVFDLRLDGKLRRYSKRVREVARLLDPAMFDPEVYAAFWRKNRRLYGMPDLNDCIDGAVKEISLGGMIQRLWQTVELQAIHIEALRTRIDG